MLKAPEETFSITKMPDSTVCTKSRTRGKVAYYVDRVPLLPPARTPSARARSPGRLPLRHT